MIVLAFLGTWQMAAAGNRKIKKNFIFEKIPYLPF
jgi:hypothetical protein